MNKNLILKVSVLGLAAGSLLLASACNRPSERPSVVAKSVSEKVMEIKAISEVTAEGSKTVYVSGGEKADVTKLDGDLKQVKIEGKVDALIKKIKSDKTKKALEEQLKNGAIALVVLKGEIKVLKVVPDVELTLNYDVLSLKYMSRMKALAKANDIKVQSDIANELNELKYQSPKSLGEKFGLVELTSLKVEKFGILDNERNDYDEKKSTLNVQDRPFDVSTHILVGDEVSAAAAGEDTEKK